ncbi:MAG TPA: TetR/AcrR family transcriptional regulator [Lapidilactobacillus dextrinicus]|jgi:AcrR family transcriptional regulator|uniref:HTH tetR-type domain-containing protein n=2 Tax=Lapidilactobacillus dextrinicus TaxID=51664 RepID=A0A0R2BSE5_9LACO|nr:TetR/AcrR family transcriptional regulator [Lapidilactobacillus dextrinicus]KRM78854.1 hypothetical protein FC84_GL000006 [Lapidilactobacillus dextrinicus DSM 20335]QFG47493.1 TetR family transcriptional regulator [Lapidilactobacillus dextrinicus]HJE15810.1 TetR/AcrR family transcriptional regulator [Lapidilactobacillus dextrinicus]
MSNEYITKHAFMNALLTLTEHQDFNKLTVSQITREVDMHRQSFYYHFHDKYDLLSYTYHELSFTYFDKDQVTLDNWLEQTKKMLTSINEHKAFYTNTAVSDQNTLLLTFSKVIQARLEDMLTEINSDQRLSDYDRRFYAEFFGYGCAGTLVDWIIGGYQIPPKDIAEKFAKLIQDIKHYSPKL